MAQGSAGAFASPGITVSVVDNTTTQFSATATDAAGRTSACSNSLTYVEDSTPPAAPTITTTAPASPANNNSPKVKGTAAAGTTVKIYASGTCSGSPVAQGSAGAFASPGITVSVADNTTTQFRARATDAAGNNSGCSNSLTYVEDSTPPAAPTITTTAPASPANNNSPKVKGTAAAGTTVKIYASGTCSGSPVAQGSAGAFASPGITVSVADNTTTQFRARATDAAGNNSGCSGTFKYVEDSNPPDTTITAGPSGTTTDRQPTFYFKSSESNSTFKCRYDSETFRACSGNGSDKPGTALSLGTHIFSVRAHDAAKNADPSPAQRTFTVVG